MAKKKSKHRRVDFSTYKPIHDRGFNPAYMEQLQDSLIARNYNEPQRLAFLSTALHESGGNPKAVAKGKDKNGKSVKFSGLYQWGDDRFPNSWNLGDQIYYALESAESNDTRKSWTDGGSGVPYIRRASEGRDAFWNSENPYDATLYFNKGYVRPAEEQARINRAEEAANMAKNLFDFGGSVTSAEDSYWWGQIPSYMKQNYNPTVAEMGYTNVTLPNLNKTMASNGLANAIVNPSSVSPIATDLKKEIPGKIDVKVGGKSLAEGPLTNQELGIKPKTDWNAIAGKATAGLGAAIDIAQSTMANAKIKDTTGIQTAIDAAANTTFGGSTNEQLMAQYGAIENLDRTSQRDLTGSVGSKLANTGKATLSGVQAGMQIGGPIGGIIGGAIGAIGSGIGWGIGDTKAQNEADRLNREAKAAEQRRLANFDLAVNNLEQQNLMYDMANYAKYGGKLLKKSKKYLGNKYGDGGNTNLAVEQPGLDWMNYWYSQRADIFKDNLEAATGSEFSKETAAKILNSNINRAKDTPSVIVSRKTGKLKQKDTNWKYEQETNPYFNKWSSEDKEYNKKRFSNPGLKGYFTENDDSRGNYIVYPEDVNESTALHEQLHSGGFNPAVEAIRRKADEGWEANDSFRSKFNNPDYVYQPEEIYARLGQLRQALNLDPSKKYTFEDISKLKNTYRSFENDWWNKPKTLPDNYEEVKNLHILDAFSPKDLEYLFNNVADNSNSNVELPEQMNYINPYEEVNIAAEGGPIFNEFSNGITKINEGGSHEENPYEGVQVGVDNEGIPNLVEEGEVIFNDYVFSDRLVVPDKVRTKYKLRKSDDLSFADAANEIQKMSEEMPNDPIVKRTMETQMQELMMEQEQVRMKKDKNKRKNKFAKGGIMSPLEYIEPALSVGQGLQSLFIKPDYSHLNAYEDAINAANVKVSSSPVRTNMRYTPMDTRSLLSESSANRAATTRALMNTSGANPAIARTALTNADYNYNNQLGKLWRSIEETEYNRQLGFEQFRTNLENANRARDLQIAGINADILAKNAALRGDYANRQLAIDNATSAVISGNIDAAKQSLAGLARQATYADWLKMLQDNKALVNNEGKKEKANGGKIKRKRRLS